MRNFELAYLTTAIIMIVIMVYTARHSKVPTFSHIALSSKLARYTFFWGLSAAALFLAILMYGWFIPHFSLGLSIKVLVFVMTVSQVLTGFFPVDNKRFINRHLLFASILSLCMITFIICLVVSPVVNEMVRVFNGIVILALLVAASTLRLPRSNPKQLLYHEYIFFGLWHTAILVTTYFG
jgi:hypothetical protein